MSLKKDFGQRLKEIRVKKGITQFQLAEQVGIDAKHMSHIETGRSFPKADLIEKFSFVLEVDYNEFFNTEHFKGRENILDSLSKILQNAGDEELKRIYRLIINLLY